MTAKEKPAMAFDADERDLRDTRPEDETTFL
jgi:hypothetical protein